MDKTEQAIQFLEAWATHIEQKGSTHFTIELREHITNLKNAHQTNPPNRNDQKDGPTIPKP